MPDNTRPPRHLPEIDQRPPLGAKAIMRAIQELATARRLVGFRVAYENNARGEHVVTLVFPPQPA